MIVLTFGRGASPSRRELGGVPASGGIAVFVADGLQEAFDPRREGAVARRRLLRHLRVVAAPR